MKTVGGLEHLGNLAVQFANHFVDGLLPRRVGIFTGHDGVEKLSQSHLGYLEKAIRNLDGHKE